MDPAVAAAVVVEEYALGTQATATLLHSGINDTFAIDVGGERYALRIHNPGKWWIRDEGSARFELDLLRHLHARGVRVAYPIPRRNGAFLGRVPATGRYYTLFVWVPDEQPGISPVERARRMGHAVGDIHLASADFQTSFGRYRLDAQTLLDRAMQVRQTEMQKADPVVARFIEEEVGRVREQLQAFDPQPDGWGIVHGDIHDLNINFTADGQVTFFDFDLCGYGWLAYDVAYYYTRIPEPHRQAFLDGYEEVRRLSGDELDMLPVLAKAAWVKEETMVGPGLLPDTLAENLRDPYL